MQGVDDSQGNIHTGVLPPWLRTADPGSEQRSKVIGPTVEVYQKHCKMIFRIQVEYISSWIV